MKNCKEADEFINKETQFHLGKLLTEQPHHITKRLSETAEKNLAEGVNLLLQVDDDVVNAFAKWVKTKQWGIITKALLRTMTTRGRIFFCGCGSTGRLSILLTALWRGFWQNTKLNFPDLAAKLPDLEQYAHSCLAGGDFALIKAVENYEDFSGFGRRQLGEMGVKKGDVVFSITEGGETSFVIGTAWKGLEEGAEVFFVYNNPNECLRDIDRSREIIDEPRITKINLTTGPMAITCSTRMQATTIELIVLAGVIESALSQFLSQYLNDDEMSCLGYAHPLNNPSFYAKCLKKICMRLREDQNINSIVKIARLEADVYSHKGLNSYLAGEAALDILTDTTERSPTFGIPPFRKMDDKIAEEPWSSVFMPQEHNADAWRSLLKREISGIEWDKGYTRDEILKFEICKKTGGIKEGDSAIAVIMGKDEMTPGIFKTFFMAGLQEASSAGARAGIIYIGDSPNAQELDSWNKKQSFLEVSVIFGLEKMPTLLGIWHHLTLKMILNTISTATMVKMGRITGNFMSWVIPGNKKLIDRAARFVSETTGNSYDDSCRAIYEAMSNGATAPVPAALSYLRNRR